MTVSTIAMPITIPKPRSPQSLVEVEETAFVASTC